MAPTSKLTADLFREVDRKPLYAALGKLEDDAWNTLFSELYTPLSLLDESIGAAIYDAVDDVQKEIT